MDLTKPSRYAIAYGLEFEKRVLTLAPTKGRSYNKSLKCVCNKRLH